MEENEIEKIVLVDKDNQEIEVEVVDRIRIDDKLYLLYTKDKDNNTDEEVKLYIVRLNQNEEIEEIQDDTEYQKVLNEINKIINEIGDDEDV